MLKRERQVYILQEVNLHNKVLAPDLSQHINVSDDTLRRHLQELAEAGKLIKVHGGAMFPAFHRGHHSSKDVYSYHQFRITLAGLRKCRNRYPRHKTFTG